VREGIELPSGEVMKDVDENGYKYLGVLQTDRVMNVKMKERIRVEYLRRVKLLARSKLNGGNVIAGINAWAIGVMRYSAGILDWGKGELRQLDVKTRKLLTMFGAFHKRGSVDRLYLKRKEGGRGLISVEECVRAEEKSLCEYVSNSEEWMLKVVVEMGVVSGGESREEYQRRVCEERRERLGEKVLHGWFFGRVKDVAHERSWEWLRAGYMAKSSEAYVCAAQEQALRTRMVRAKIDGEDVSAKCRLCGKIDETAMHLASGCGELAKKQYTVRHDRMGVRVHWELCKKYGVKCEERWYDHVPSIVSTNKEGDVDIYWNMTVVTAKGVAHNRPDVVVVNRKERKWTLVDFSVPMDQNVASKEQEKVEKYQALATEIRKMYGVRTEIVPIIIGALGTIPKRLPGYLKDLGVPDMIGSMQISVLLSTTRILKNALSL
jgi:hypothetical protein